jgi:hypothetical protein
MPLLDLPTFLKNLETYSDEQQTKLALKLVTLTFLRTAVHHIHLTASEAVLRERYSKRGSGTKEFLDYNALKRSSTERGVEKLARSS